ncbi:MAG: BatA domain-containing protein, partial [Pseudomonadota bacterium]|nr:BatA domain-containing protein [Pseudomonadota bacterium]
MSLALLLPLGLAALAALLVPLLVHLARRSEERMVNFAALRWLQSRPQPRRKRRFDEYLLLLLRLLLLAALALLLAEPVLYGQPDRRPWTVVMPGVDTAALPPALPDARMHWLAAGFPRVDPANVDAVALPAAEASPSSLLRQLDADLPAGTPLTVVVPETLDGADAERPRLSRQVSWEVVAAAPT